MRKLRFEYRFWRQHFGRPRAARFAWGEYRYWLAQGDRYAR